MKQSYMYIIYRPDNLEKAVRQGNIRKVASLIKGKWYRKPYKIDQFYKGNTFNDGFTPLAIAASMGNKEMVAFLIANGADPNLRSIYNWSSYPKGSIGATLYGRTALMLAAENGQINIVELLLLNGANVNLISAIPTDFYLDGRNPPPWDSAETALFLALRSNHYNIAVFLKKYGGKIKIYGKYPTKLPDKIIGSYESYASNSNYYSCVDGDLYNSNQEDLLACDKSRTGNYIIRNSVRAIRRRAFSNLTGLNSVLIPNSVIYIEDSAFEGCTGLKFITIPSSISEIRNFTFEGCSGLASISLPDTIKSIGASAFASCASLRSINIPESVTYIMEGAFEGCTSLESIFLSNSETEIRESVFEGCNGLRSIVIPARVTSIHEFAFMGCIGLRSITSLNSTPPKIRRSSFHLVNKSIQLLVPPASVTDYKTANFWNEFLNIKGIC
jgi:hypothetical protein